MKSISLNAYAKINIYLDVTARRDDGYHMLETVMHTISLCDIVSLSRHGEDISISCSDPTIPCDSRNIVYKCADAFFSKCGINDRGISIDIQKNIPSQAGLGGGSADGAAVLKGLNRLFGTALTDDKLCSIAAPIGADIPFCIMGGCGWCTGIGDEISQLPAIKGSLLIAKGTEGVSTAEAYRKIDSLGHRLALKDVQSVFVSSPDYTAISPYCRNLFEEAVSPEEVGRIKAIILRKGACAAAMTGSGSAVFGLFKTDDDMAAACSTLKEEGFFAQICRFIGKDTEGLI